MRLVISDAHSGLKEAIGSVMLGAAWQRCRVHFMRNALAKVPKAAADMVAATIRTIFAQPTGAMARAQLEQVADRLEPGFPDVAAMLTEAAEDLLAFSTFPVKHWKKIWSTNPLERVNKEIPVLEWSLPDGLRRRPVRWVTVPGSDSKEISDATSTWWLSSA